MSKKQIPKNTGISKEEKILVKLYNSNSSKEITIKMLKMITVFSFFKIK